MNNVTTTTTIIASEDEKSPGRSIGEQKSEKTKMRLTTWNVNGIRNPFSYPPWNTARTFPAMFDILGSDIVVMQELKIQRKDLRDDMVLVDGWDCYFSLPKHKKGYSGVGIYTRTATCAPIRAEEGLLGVLPSANGTPYCELPEKESIGGYPSALKIAEWGIDPAALDAEGRCLVLEFPAFVLFGVYSPANSNGLRDDFRYSFICALDCRIRNLIRNGKRVVLVGDLNVSRSEIDTASASEDIKKALITHEEYISTPNRRVFNQLLVGGEVIGERDEGREKGVLWDTTRGFHPDRIGMYTHWEQKINARPGNFGSRIDFVLVCEEMKSWVKNADIQNGLLGSDHCPVFADFYENVTVNGEETAIVDVMNPEGTFSSGVRKKEWQLQSVPLFSGKRMPEFDKRRTIKSMFAAPAQKKALSVEQGIASDTNTLSLSSLGKIDAADSLSTNGTLVNGSQSTAASRSPLKRKPSVPPKQQPTKRQKPDTSSQSMKGQQSLKGFFMKEKPSASTSGRTPSSIAVKLDNQSSATEIPRATPNDLPRRTEDQDSSIEGIKTPARQNDLKGEESDISPSQFSTMLAAAEENQKSWGALFSRPIAPLCEGHDEPCKTMLTKKKGSNQGRSFWMCARPLGPSGNKEKGTEWRCATFIWSSDWAARKEHTARRNDTDLEHIKALLKHTVVKLERLHRNPSLFSSITESEKFFKQGIKLLLRIQKHNNAWQAMEEAIRKFEELNKDKARSLPPLEGAVGENTSTWTVWCRNNVLFPSPGEIQEAEIYKTMLPMICQTLPLGGIYILEHWRQEAESVIQPLLRVENRPRKAGQIIRDQQATPRRIYIVDTAAKEQSKTTIRLIEVKSERQHMQVHTQITVEPIDGLAGLLAKFNKSLVRGSAYGISALLLKNSCSASRIRDRLGPKTCIWNAEKFLA
ncbi:putative DNA lyase [Acrodontium crateriforme]|uniref:DNA-(apurinic or apyrimidinic site) endonuclease 2 n=1 Tax=Acrodontium crateriforme TaxID=150365 RepID=A0AAQ3MB96_9PEZI|nr:putative DNA lyase [Acrodontium crateriforme]